MITIATVIEAHPHVTLWVLVDLLAIAALLGWSKERS